MKETFSVILFANEAEIQTKTVTNIDLATTQTLDFAWNATGFPLGNYIITATASIVPGETQVWDNIYVDGTVSITEETLVYVYPRITWTKPNQTFTIAIGVCNVVDMLTCGVGLHFDSTVLTWISGGVLQGSEVVAIRSFQPPITGNAILLRITFQGKEEGISSLHLDEMDTGLFDSHYNIIPSTKVDGEAHVAEHGIMVTKATPYKSIVGQGYSVKINATVENRGFFTETFNVAIFANTTLVQIQTIHNLAGGNFTTINFTWGTTGFAIGNYNITVYATPVSGETGTTDNNMTGGWVLVTIPGDVDGDLENGRYDVDLYDAVRLLARYGAKEGEPNFDPNCDIDNDGRVFLFDAVILLSHYGQKYP
jgi:hypothetical protein